MENVSKLCPWIHIFAIIQYGAYPLRILTGINTSPFHSFKQASLFESLKLHLGMAHIKSYEPSGQVLWANWPSLVGQWPSLVGQWPSLVGQC